MHSTSEQQRTDDRPAAPVRLLAQRPVFVDSSGRRPRRARRIGWLLVVPAAGYVALMVSTALGGPTVHAPFLPLPQAQPTVAAPQPSVAHKPVTAATPHSSRTRLRTHTPSPSHSKPRSHPGSAHRSTTPTAGRA